MRRNYLIYLLHYVLISCVLSEDDLWYSYQFNSGYGNRRELVINKVDAIDNFKTQEQVLEWRTLSFSNCSFALGFNRNNVTLLKIVASDKQDEIFSVQETITPMNGTIYDASIFKYWNEKATKSEIVAIVAVSSNANHSDVELVWFRINANDNKLINIWKWGNNKKIIHFNVFELRNRFTILLANERYRNYTTADLYEFHLGQHNDFWLKQAIHLENPTNSTAINTFRDKIFLSIPQNETLRIFELDNNGYFKSYKNLTVGQVSFVTSFKVGFQSFIAIDGFSAGIFEFTKTGLVKRHIEQADLKNINYWLSIPISTYRDEEVLIAERTLHHNPHKSHAIQVIIQHGGSFVLHDEMTCDFYGELSNGLNCLVEEDQDDQGIFGSAFFNINGTIGVLVPRYEKASGLFVIHTEMKELPSPLEEHINSLNTRKETIIQKLEKFMKNEKVAIPMKTVITEKPMVMAATENEPQAALGQSAPIIELNTMELSNRVSKLQEKINKLMLQSATIPSFTSEVKEYDTVVLNGPVQVIARSNVKEVNAEFINDEMCDLLLNNIYNVNDERPVTGHKTFLTLRTNKLEFDAINGQPADSIAYQSKQLVINGDLKLNEPLTVDGDVETTRINNLIVNDEIVSISHDTKLNGTLNFENLSVRDAINSKKVNKFPIHQNYQDATPEETSTLDGIEIESAMLPGNLTVTLVNGENFNDLLSSLCPTNIWIYIPGKTIVSGDIHVKNEASTFFLNGLEYPQNYVLAKSNIPTKITGEKTFNNELEIEELITTGTVNGIDSKNLINLSAKQDIESKLKFANLAVTNSLDLLGEIVSTEESEFFTKKPTLLDTKELTSDVNFKELEVTGSISMDNKLNGADLKAILSDVIYRDEEEATITGLKTFPFGFYAMKDLRIESNSINKIAISDFVDTESEQTLQIPQLNGDVTIENLLLVGTWDGVDIDKLDQESVKLTGEQFISAEIVFEDGLALDQLDIRGSLNEIPLDQYLQANQDVNLNNLTVHQLTVENLVVKQNLDAQESNFDIHSYDQQRFSLTRDQIITAPFTLNASKIENFKATLINEIPFDQLFDADVYAGKVIDMIFAKQLAIKNLIVDDSVTIESVNGKGMDDILKNCLSNPDGERTLNMQFENVRFGDLVVDRFNDIEFEEFRSNLVYKDEKTLDLFGLTVYFNGFEVRQYIQTNALNQLSIYNILRKNEQQKVNSPIIIYGDVVLHGENQLGINLNRMPMELIMNSFQSLDENTYQIRGDAVFTYAPIIRELLTKRINGISLDKFLEDVVYLNNDQTQMMNNITFNAGVHIKGNLHVNETINGIDLNVLKDEIVLVSEDGIVQSSVVFADDVIVKEEVEIDSNLFAKDLYGVNPSDWIDNALFINRGKLAGELHFESVVIENEVKTNFLNGIDMQSLIPLRRDFYINQTLDVQELAAFRDVRVDGLVNGVKLEPEYLNSVTNNRIQEICGNIIFKGNVLVRGNLDIYGHVNEHDFSKIVTTDTDQVLNTSYRFLDKVSINNDLNVDGLINGINLTRWMNEAVKKDSKSPQVISNPWKMENNLNFKEDVSGNGLINGFNIQQLADQIEHRRQFKSTVESELINNYMAICEDINEEIDATKKQIYRFKYLENKHFIELESNIELVQQFVYDEKNYLLIKDAGCTSKLFEWINNKFMFINEFETGLYNQVITVPEGENVYFITRDNSSQTSDCSIEGTNVWKFIEDKIELVQKLDDHSLLQKSKIPGTFYAIKANSILEYKLSTNPEFVTFVVQKWILPADLSRAIFLQPGLKTGLSILTPTNLYKLNRESTFNSEFDVNTNVISIGNYTVLKNHFMPLNGEDFAFLHIGHPRWKTMVAVASHEKSSVQKKLDFIKIYEDPLQGKLFHNIATYKPSSLISLEFGENGETLLIFLENEEILQIYEYKGIEGFKFRADVDIEANRIVALTLPEGTTQKSRSFIGLINKNHFTLLEAVMDGDQLDMDDVQCTLE